MFEINSDKQKIIPQRAPHNREAPLPLKTPVARRRKPTNFPTGSTLNEILKNNKSMQFDQNTGFHGGPSARRKGYRLALWSWFASTIDALILIAASCVFLFVFSLIVKSSMGGILAGIAQGHHRLLLFAEVYAMLSWIYMISIRSLMGASIGEWTCDLRLGQPHERMQVNYMLRVFLRSTLIVLTGVITMPMLSLVFGKDIAGVCSGLRLFSLK